MRKKNAEGKGKFVPLLTDEHSFLFQVDSQTFTRSVVLQMLEALNAGPEDAIRHAELLESRATGKLSYPEDCFLYGTHKTLDNLRTILGIPSYSVEVGPDRKCSVTLDVFNGGNVECRLPIYREDRVLLHMLISVREFPLTVPRTESDLRLLVEGHTNINRLVHKIVRICKPEFAIGTYCYNQLNTFVLGFHWAKSYISKKYGWRDFWWQCTYGIDMNYEGLSDIRHPFETPFPFCKAYIEEWPEGRYVWAPVDEDTATEFYALASGLRSFHSLHLKRIPDALDT